MRRGLGVTDSVKATLAAIAHDRIERRDGGTDGRQAHRAILEDFQRRPVEAEVAQRGVAAWLEGRDADVGDREVARHGLVGQPAGEDDPPPALAPTLAPLCQAERAPAHRQSAAGQRSGRCGRSQSRRRQQRLHAVPGPETAGEGGDRVAVGGMPSAARVAATSAASRRPRSKRSVFAPQGVRRSCRAAPACPPWWRAA